MGQHKGCESAPNGPLPSDKTMTPQLTHAGLDRGPDAFGRFGGGFPHSVNGIHQFGGFQHVTGGFHGAFHGGFGGGFHGGGRR